MGFNPNFQGYFRVEFVLPSFTFLFEIEPSPLSPSLLTTSEIDEEKETTCRAEHCRLPAQSFTKGIKGNKSDGP